MHGEQNGSVYQEVTLGRSDVGPVRTLAEGRARVLECCLDSQYGDHGPHLHPRHTARGAEPRQRLWSLPRALMAWADELANGAGV